jgi:ABC-type sugar transport system ATPase subunit
MSTGSAVVLREVKKAFPLRGGLDLEVSDLGHLANCRRRCTVLRGRSGSGKTTLLNLIAGVTLPTAGTIYVGDVMFSRCQKRAAIASAPSMSVMCSRHST